jgi:hypothetical protein
MNFQKSDNEGGGAPGLAALVRSLAEIHPEFGSWYKQSSKRR